MFYSQFILAKKGPLGTIWIAAHLERKLRKNQVADTDIGVSVDSILFPEVPIALRLSSHLLLGVVRIYSRKVNYLFDDCSEALLKIKQAFRSTAVDLPPEESTAPYHSITLPETFDLDDFELPDNDIFQGNFIDHHVSTKEQITLQDSMDGAVYSTSQFGLDERFGDGDTSQIGLEIDEELYLDKVAASGYLVSDDNARASVQPHTVIQDGRSDEAITENFNKIVKSHGNETVSASTETKDGAQGPLTPRLQELKVSSVQEALLSDDHVEADCSYSADLGSLKCVQCLQGTLCIDQQEKDRELESLQNKAENEKQQQEHPINDMVTREQECILADEHTSMSLFAMPEEKKYLPMFSESASMLVNDVNASDNMDDTPDGVVINNQPFVAVKDSISMESARAVVSPCLSLDTKLEDPGHKGFSEMSGIPVLEFNCLLEDNPTCQKVESVNNMRISNSEGGSYPQCEEWTATADCQLGSPGAPEVDVESHMEPKEIGASIASGVKEYASDQISEPLCQEIQSDSRKLSEQFENERFDQSEDLSKSATSDLLEPEKLLALPHGPDRLKNTMLIESLPEFTAGSDHNVARAKSVSGKKRSFTESTITVQSFNSVESFGISQQRTTEIPDDDDLLSSILVGRRSSIVRIKSTPAALGAESSKRPRTANRSSMSKRKVLMDDAMVLHGDMIRQQLTNAEDIRRIRRKAPCTYSEILTIQRQFLEDEIFREPVLTGMSQELIYLHSKRFDLRVTVVTKSSPNIALETCDKRESNMSISGTERDISRSDGELQLLASDVEALHTEIALSKESHQTKDKLEPDGITCHAKEDIISDAKSVETYQHSEVIIDAADVRITNDKLGPNDTPYHALTEATSDLNLETSKQANVHITGKDVKITDGMDASVVHGLEASITCNPLCVDNCTIQDGGTIVENNNSCEGYIKQISGFSTGTNVEGPLTVEDALSEDNHVETRILVTGNNESDVGKEVRTDWSESHTCELVTIAKDSREVTNPSSINLHKPVNGIGNANLNGVDDDQVPPLELSCQEKDLIICSEETTAYSIELDFDKKDTSLNDEENQILHDARNQIIADAFNHHLVDVFCDNSATINDTGFLNVEDADVEDDDDGILHAEHLENSGWSSRTRAVANYLRTLFDKEALVDKKSLYLDNLLTGKTRKEASRMFFETLVLKTKDYIHVEQIHSYDVVHIRPRPKLMKLEF